MQGQFHSCAIQHSDTSKLNRSGRKHSQRVCLEIRVARIRRSKHNWRGHQQHCLSSRCCWKMKPQIRVLAHLRV
jgi:hypothetical protein